MDIKNVRIEKKILEAKLLQLILDFEKSTDTEISEVSLVKSFSVGNILSIIKLDVNVKV